MNSAMKADQYQDIGLYLRDVRESLHVSLEHAARDLHIRPQYLQAIEAGALSKIPNRIYARGYIRNYAAYLQLPPQEVLEAYDALLQDHPMQFFIPEPTLKQNLPTGYVVQIALGRFFCSTLTGISPTMITRQAQRRPRHAGVLRANAG